MKVNWGFEPLPSSSAFGDIFDSSAIVADMATAHENHLRDLFKQADETNENRLIDKISDSINRLQAYQGKAKQRLHSESILNGLREQSQSAIDLNVSNNHAVADLAKNLTVACDSITSHEQLKNHEIRTGFIATLSSLIGNQQPATTLQAKPVEIQPVIEPVETVQQVQPIEQPKQTGPIAYDF